MPNILIVDDSDIWRRLAEDVLKQNSYHLLEADSGEQALEVARENSVDLVIIDYRMHRLNGLVTSRQLREIPGCEHVPVILITSEKFPGDCEEKPAPHVDGYLNKKYLIQDLDGCVKRHLGQCARVACCARIEAFALRSNFARKNLSDHFFGVRVRTLSHPSPKWNDVRDERPTALRGRSRPLVMKPPLFSNCSK